MKRTMTLNWKDFLRKCQFPLMMALGTLPVFVLTLHMTAPDFGEIFWAFPAAYVLLSWICLVLPGKLRLIAGPAGCAALMGLGFRLLPCSASLMCLLIPLLYAGLLLYGLRMGGWSRTTELPPAWLAVYVVCHVAGQLMVDAARRTGDKPLLESAAPVMLLAFIGCAALCMLSLNRATMHQASMGRQRIPTMMRRRNVIFSLVLLALVLFIAAMPQVVRMVEKAWQYLLQVIMAIIAFITKLLPQSSGGGSGGGDMDMSGLGGEAAEPSLLAIIMEKVMTVIAVLAMAALCIFLAVKLYQKLKIFMKFLADRLALFAHTSSEDFEDEVTDTRDEGEKERISVLDSLRRRLVRVDEKKLSPTQRIRYRYLRLMMKHPEWHASQTARESLPPDAASLYERARYSGEEASPQEAESFAQQIRQL